MIRFMLDTNICVEMLRRRSADVVERLLRCRQGEVSISSVTFAELQYGAAKSARPAYHAAAITEFCAPLDIAPFDSSAAQVYGHVRAVLEQRGRIIGPLDTLIAAHALSMDVTLVTNNEREFRRIADLRVENWVKTP